MDRFNTEADLAHAARIATKGRTQDDIAEAYGVPQSVVSQAFAYADNPANRTRGHRLRRRILLKETGVRIAGPYWKAVNPGDDPPGFWAEGEDSFPRTT